MLRFGKPYPFEDGKGGWKAPYQIVGLEDDNVHFIFGEDAVQALELVMKFVATPLELSDAYREGRLTLDGSRDLGFPALTYLDDEDPVLAIQRYYPQIYLACHTRHQRA